MWKNKYINNSRAVPVLEGKKWRSAFWGTECKCPSDPPVIIIFSFVSFSSLYSLLVSKKLLTAYLLFIICRLLELKCVLWELAVCLHWLLIHPLLSKDVWNKIFDQKAYICRNFKICWEAHRRFCGIVESGRKNQWYRYRQFLW